MGRVRSRGRGDGTRSKGMAFAAVLAAALGPGSGAPALLAEETSGEGLWKLAFEDDFDRSELGPDWFVRSGTAEIRSGRLYLRGAGATALIRRAFADDVRLEFLAEADPELPPCDLSAALASSEFWGYHYLLAFGGNHNRLNQIVGGGARKVDERPSRLIDGGKTYRLAAIREGRRLAYEVDGVLLIESEDPDPVGGPGFDRAGLVTWSGMYVDRVRVSERVRPAPGGAIVLRTLPDFGWRWEGRRLSYDGPASEALSSAAASYNARRYREAAEAFASASPPDLATVAGLAYVLGDLAFEESAADKERLARLAAEVARRSGGDPRAREFALAAEWFRRLTPENRDRVAATRLSVIGPEKNPFFSKAELYRARYHHAWAREAGDSRRVVEALEIFARLRETWPDVLALREFAGERVLWGPEFVRAESAGPRWARHLEECLRRQHAVLGWWFGVRQAPDGQLGGGWGDDVEILRSWAPAALVASGGRAPEVERAVAGTERLAEGVWRNVLRDGYAGEVGDVEHSAEPSADSLPPLILLRYGDPLWIERNLRSAKTIRDRFLARNDRGRLQFRSAEFGADGVRDDPRAGGDTGYHARPMRHFLYLAWWGIPEARDAYLAWCETWREAVASGMGTKPPGFAPASIFFPSGGIEPPDGRAWYDGAAHYYGFPGIPKKIHEALLAAASLGEGGADPRFLEPVRAMLRLATAGPPPEERPERAPGDPENLRAHVVHQATGDVLSVYRSLTGDRTYDDLIVLRGSPVQRFAVDGDLEGLAGALERALERLRFGWTQLTSEVLQTDRAGLPAADLVAGAYTGAVRDLTDSGALTFAATWDVPELEFAAVVTEATRTSLRVLLHGFAEEEWRAGVRPWRLVPGRYVLAVGELEGLEARDAARGRERPERVRRLEEREVEHVHRGAPIAFRLPPRRTTILELRLREPIARPAVLPDLALSARDVRREGGRVRVTVHNVGGAPAGPFRVAVEGEGGEEIASAAVEGLPGIRDFVPSAREVEIVLPSGDGGLRARGVLRVRADPDGAVEEISEENNVAAVLLAPGAG